MKEADFFNCSPLSCNYLCETYSVNQYCLIDKLENAYKYCLRIEKEKCEPGPYYLYEIGYDHLVNLQVEMGETITPGDTIGYPRPLFMGLGAFEIMVNNYETGLSYCPFCCFNPDKIEAYQNKLNQLIQDWETFKNDTTIYNESDFVFPGCLMESMVSY